MEQDGGGGWLWLIGTVIGVAVLAFGMLYGIAQRRRSRATEARSETVTRQHYDEPSPVEPDRPSQE